MLFRSCLVLWPKVKRSAWQKWFGLNPIEKEVHWGHDMKKSAFVVLNPFTSRRGHPLPICLLDSGPEAFNSWRTPRSGLGRWCVTMTKTVPGIVLTLYHYFDGSCMPGESPWITNWVNLLRPSNLAAVKGRRPCEREPSILHLFSSIRFHVVGMRSTTAFSSAFPTASSVWLLTEQKKPMSQTSVIQTYI